MRTHWFKVSWKNGCQGRHQGRLFSITRFVACCSDLLSVIFPSCGEQIMHEKNEQFFNTKRSNLLNYYIKCFSYLKVVCRQILDPLCQSDSTVWNGEELLLWGGLHTIFGPRGNGVEPGNVRSSSVSHGNSSDSVMIMFNKAILGLKSRSIS